MFTQEDIKILKCKADTNAILKVKDEYVIFKNSNGGTYLGNKSGEIYELYGSMGYPINSNIFNEAGILTFTTD